VVGSVTLGAGDYRLVSSVTDGIHGYFGTDTVPGRVAKVRLADLEVVGSVTLGHGDNCVDSAPTDGTYGYFGTGTSPARVVKVHLATLTRVGAASLTEGERDLRAAVRAGPRVFFGADTTPGRVVAVGVVPSAPQRPAPPRVTVRPRALVVSVTAPASGPEPTSWVATASPGGRSCQVAAPARSCTIAGLNPATAYRVTVVARNTSGASARSAVSRAVRPRTVPAAPRFLQATRGGTRVALGWVTPPSNGGSRLTGYRVQRSTNGRNWTTVRTTRPSVRTTTLGGLRRGTTYRFRVVALNAAGAGTPSTVTTVRLR